MSMIVAGVMSGTSADGINVALVRLSTRGRGRPRYTLLAHEEYPFPAPVRRAVLAMMNAELALVADLARLNFLLGELYAEAVTRTARKHRVKLDLVGCHGQTLYHQGVAQRFLGRKLAVTWQTGEGAVIAVRLGVPVVSDFRPADMAAGGKGAPLVPFLDYFLFANQRDGSIAQNRVVQNIGGIANLTVIPAGTSLRQVIAFDTGPGNMVMDAVMEELFGKRYDRDGKIAASGRVLDGVTAKLLSAKFFREKPPRTAGREEFGREYVSRFLQLCRGVSKPDMVATATALTARSIADAVQRFVLPRFAALRPAKHQRRHNHQMIVSGGGAKNPTLMAMLHNEIAPFGISLHSSDEFGLPAEAKEAVAFAVLAHETWHRRPSNVPSATGAKRAAILGKISYA
ncbi:MAG TPA: anhydro-N-acetylmuramic acid kinase [Terriglobales bacterium]|jgi:anhydro-N-acetylmuramic acid kinase|nr:anhydro-N-acetylmuramic acid kinase [Terriglobales bacterium]